MAAAGLFGSHRFRSLFFLLELRRMPRDAREACDDEQSQNSPGGSDVPVSVSGAPNMFLLAFRFQLILSSFLIAPTPFKKTPQK